MCDKGKLLAEWHAEEHKLQKACDQLDALNRKLDTLTERHLVATARKHAVTAYNTQIQLSVLEGVLSMYHEYASRRAAHMSAIFRQVQNCPTYAESDFGANVDLEMDMDSRV